MTGDTPALGRLTAISLTVKDVISFSHAVDQHSPASQEVSQCADALWESLGRWWRKKIPRSTWWQRLTKEKSKKRLSLAAHRATQACASGGILTPDEKVEMTRAEGA